MDTLALLFCALLSLAPSMPIKVAEAADGPPDQTLSGVHDFDALVGNWTVRHRKLRAHLVDSHDWYEFAGTMQTRQVMDGYGNIEDNVLAAPQGTYRAVALRSYDPKTDQWSIWWLDGRSPLGPLDPPVRGRFVDGLGSFYADDVFNGKPVRLRYLWSGITATSAHWEQALSADGGQTWETNWTMDVTRMEENKD